MFTHLPFHPETTHPLLTLPFDKSTGWHLMEIYENWWEEKRSAYVYYIMAEHERNILHRKLFLDLHHAAEQQTTL